MQGSRIQGSLRNIISNKKTISFEGKFIDIKGKAKKLQK